VIGQLGDRTVSLCGAQESYREMSEADLTPAVSLGGLRGYYARASTRDPGHAPSQVVMQLIPLMIFIGIGLVLFIFLMIFFMLK